MLVIQTTLFINSSHCFALGLKTHVNAQDQFQGCFGKGNHHTSFDFTQVNSFLAECTLRNLHKYSPQWTFPYFVVEWKWVSLGYQESLAQLTNPLLTQTLPFCGWPLLDRVAVVLYSFSVLIMDLMALHGMFKVWDILFRKHFTQVELHSTNYVTWHQN